MEAREHRRGREALAQKRVRAAGRLGVPVPLAVERWIIGGGVGAGRPSAERAEDRGGEAGRSSCGGAHQPHVPAAKTKDLIASRVIHVLSPV
jgi:hypothetical protein